MRALRPVFLTFREPFLQAEYQMKPKIVSNKRELLGTVAGLARRAVGYIYIYVYIPAPESMIPAPEPMIPAPESIIPAPES